MKHAGSSRHPFAGKKKKKKFDTEFTPFEKINSELIINLNIKCKITQLLEDNIGKTS